MSDVVATTRVARNAGLAKDLQRSPELVKIVERAAEAAARNARAVAPVDEGDYRDGIEATVVDGPDGPVGRVNAHHWTSHWIEWGSAHNSVHAPLRRGARAAGLSFEEKSRS